MKYFVNSIVLLLLYLSHVIAQQQSGINAEEKNSEIVKLSRFRSIDPNEHPITDQVIQEFCDYIKNSPIIDDSSDASKVGSYKASTAQGLYEKSKDLEQKRKIIDVILDTLKRIQKERDALGVDPLSSTESHPYVDPPIPMNEQKNNRERMIESERRSNEMMTRRNRLSKKISDLRVIYGNFYRSLTRMKVPLGDIPSRLAPTPEDIEHPKNPIEKGENQTHKSEGSKNSTTRHKQDTTDSLPQTLTTLPNSTEMSYSNIQEPTPGRELSKHNERNSRIWILVVIVLFTFLSLCSFYSRRRKT